MAKFLIIDDDPDDVELFCGALREIDSHVECKVIEGGQVAILEIAEQLSDERPDLIFLDVHMPIVNGWTVLYNLKSDNATRSIPVIMYSTVFSDKDVERAEQLGATSYFVKPYDYHDLKSGLSTFMHHYQKGTLEQLTAHH